MPPVSVEVWGGMDAESLTLLNKIQVRQLTEDDGVIGEHTARVPIQASGNRYYKVVAHPFRKLPSWHNDKGEKAWVFVDEVFFY